MVVVDAVAVAVVVVVVLEGLIGRSRNPFPS